MLFSNVSLLQTHEGAVNIVTGHVYLLQTHDEAAVYVATRHVSLLQIMLTMSLCCRPMMEQIMLLPTSSLCRPMLEQIMLLTMSLCCRPMMELLFARLPKDLQLHAIKQLARFVTTSTLASVTNEASLICNAAAWAAPETCVELLMKPLLGKIEEEVKHDGTAGTGRMSKVTQPPITHSPHFHYLSCELGLRVHLGL